MVRLILRVIVNALAIAFTIAVLPGSRLADQVTQSPLPGIFGYQLIIYLFTGLAFAVIQILLRPAILLLTANVIIWSMGLFTILIDAMLFTFMSHMWWEFKHPFLFGGLLGGLVMGVSVTVLEAISGLNGPLIDERQGASKFYWRWLGLLPKGRRNRIAENLRIVQVYDTLRRYTAHIVVNMTPLGAVHRLMQRLIYSGKKRAVIDESLPETVCLMLQELGPSYVKLGQVISSRTEILPPAWQGALSKLQSTVAPFPYEDVQRIITRELGAPPEELFTSFEPTSIAAASVGQVHRATLPDGQQVVVKVQRPDIDVRLRADLNVLRDVVQLLEARTRWARNMGLSAILKEFADNVVEELDWQNEAYNARRLKHNMSVFPEVHVPHIYQKYSASRVLTMESVEGVKLTDTMALEETGIDRTRLGEIFMRAMLKQVLLDGFFHGDPHPGNVLVDPERSQLIFLDMGMMGGLDGEQRLAIADVIWSLKERDSSNLTAILLQMSTAFKEVDAAALRRDVGHMLNRHLVYSETIPSLATILELTLTMVHGHGLRIHPNLTLAIKTLVQCEQIVRVVAPHISMVDTAFSEIQKLMRQEFAAQSIADEAGRQATGTAKDLIRHIPKLREATLKWLEQYERGRLTIYLEADEATSQRLGRLERSIERSISRLTLGLVLTGLLVGSAVAGTVPGVKNWTGPTAILFAIAGLIALGLVLQLIWMLWRQRA
jgi:ubiquinone biosynthesis protein